MTTSSKKQPILPTYPLLCKTINNQAWKYYLIGNKTKPPLVILPDIMVAAESFFPFAKPLSQKFCIIIPLYPTISSMSELVTSLKDFLESFHIEKFSVIGISFGGIIAQAYLYRFPSTILNLALLTTGTSDRLYGILLAFLRMFAHVLPEFVSQYFAYTGALLSLNNSQESVVFWKRYLKQTIWQRDTKESLLAWAKCIHEVCFSPHQSLPASYQKNHMIIIQAEQDIVFPFFVRWNLNNRYPQARWHVFLKQKHLLWINKQSEVKKLLCDFFYNL